MASWTVRLESVDQRMFLALAAHRAPALTWLMIGLSALAGPVLVIPLTLVLASGLVPEVATAGRVAAIVLAASHLVVQVVKRLASRPRPSDALGVASMTRNPKCFSFPSGHATAALSVALPLAHALPSVVGYPVLVLGLLVGVSRWYLGVHYPGDVLAGWTLAALTWVALPSRWLA
ncbi:MAG: phosphatase PAP2 family protein [Gemmatimonadetes bacterium]|nr:phosphatase PAP2 family protein [Gemmatimonadota bacterium]